MKCLLPGMRTGSVHVPSSKSIAHRLLICAALGKDPVHIRLSGLSDDILATAGCLEVLGAGIQMEKDGITVTPIRKGTDVEAVLPCRESGSTLRFLLPLAGALGIPARFLMEGRLSSRPMAEFEETLRAGGMKLSREGNVLRCAGKLMNGNFSLRGDVSSQYFSGLLFSLPLLEGESRLSVMGTMESEGYVRLTEACLQQAGIFYEKGGGFWQIPGEQRPRLPDTVVTEGDWSNAAFFLCLGALSENGITLSGLKPASLQGDSAVLKILQAFGAEIRMDSDWISIRKGSCRAMTIDASPIPDLVPVLSVLACAAKGETRIVKAARLRFKESDRLRSTAALICSLGGNAEELPDGLLIHGTGMLNGGTADSFRDHRIAMSAAVASAICKHEVIVLNEECVKKSYPAFWKDYDGMEREA